MNNSTPMTVPSNFNSVLFFVGSQDVALDLPILQKYKVTHILNLASFIKEEFPEQFTYLTLKILDTPSANIKKHFEQCFQFIDEGRKNGGCVLVHCNAGVSRSSTVCIAYLMATQNMSMEKAYCHLKDARPAIRPNDGFKIQLKEFEESLKSKD